MSTPRVGRNDRCLCGSGKKHKKCCGLNGAITGLSAAPQPVTESPGISDRNPPGLPQVKKVTYFNLGNLPKDTDPCLCDSGKTFGICHLPTMRAAQKMGARIEAERRAHEEKFGEVRPIIHANWQGRKWVAVGNELVIAKESGVRTFPDFLEAYAIRVLTPAWGNAELKKPLEQRHPILQWYDALCRQKRQFEKDADGLIAYVPDGPSMAYMLLAYDLYILADHGALQERTIKRLKDPNQFQGARHELYATATCIRAGYDIQFEDEKDLSRRHVEFTARHRHTGQRIALEAKSRHRRGVLGFRPDWPQEPNPRAEVRDLVFVALEKDVDVPLVAFIDVNLPPAEPHLQNEPWFREVVGTVTTEFGVRMDEPEPFNLMVFTNQPYHYGEPGGPTPARSTLNFLSNRPRRHAAHPDAILRISEEAAKWGLIPNEFPADPRT